MLHPNVMRGFLVSAIGFATLTSVAGLGSIGARADDASPVLSVPGDPGKAIQVPLGGPLYDPQAETIAREILSTDRAIDALRQRPSSEANQALIALAQDLRTESYRNLDLAVRVASHSSGPAKDILLLAEESASAAKAVATATPPPGLQLLTEITTSLVDASLHYIAKGDYDRIEPTARQWTSYTSGDRLRIGRYVFRVQPAPPEPAFEEVVMVIAEPTKRVLQPVQKPVP